MRLLVTHGSGLKGATVITCSGCSEEPNVEFPGVAQSTWNCHRRSASVLGILIFESTSIKVSGVPAGGRVAPSRSAGSMLK